MITFYLHKSIIETIKQRGRETVQLWSKQKNSFQYIQQIWFASNQDCSRCDRMLCWWFKKKRKKRRQWYFLCERECDSFNPQSLEGQVCFCRTKLAVKAATNDPSHKQPSRISPVIWTGREKGEKKMQLPLPFPVSSLSCMKAKIQSSSCYNDSPKTNFRLAQQTQVCGILLHKPRKIVKTARRYTLLLFILPPF